MSGRSGPWTAAFRPKQRSAHQVARPRCRPDGPPPLASTSHAQYDRTTAAPADGQIERLRRRGQAVDPAHGNPDLAIAEPLGHAREPATVRLHVDIDNPHTAGRRRRRAAARVAPTRDAYDSTRTA